MSRATWRALITTALALSGGGCAYFNAMYNADHFARQAEQSERAGRMGEARDRWQSAAMHAESLTARHPKSRWVSAALLVRGRALVHLAYYADAVPVLVEATRRAERREQRDEAFALLGRAYLAISMYPEAEAALDTAMATGPASLRGEAALYRGRARLALGKPDSARADFTASSDPRARHDLARLALANGDTAFAASLLDAAVLRRPYVEGDWRPSLDTLWAAGAGAHTGALAERLAARGDLSPGQRARLLLDDGTRRLAAADTDGAARRFDAIRVVAPDSLEAKAAGVLLARLALARAATDSDLAAPRERLQALMLEGGAPGQDARAVLRAVDLVFVLREAAGAPDAFWFERAEVLRDSLHAARLAAVDFGEMARLFPESPWTPKGLVAAIVGGHAGADSLRELLERRYATSPYALAAAGSGAAADRFAALEDSLRRTLARRAGTAGDRVRRGGEVDDEPIGRRPPADAAPVRRPGRPVPARPDSSPPRQEGPPRPGVEEILP